VASADAIKLGCIQQKFAATCINSLSSSGMLSCLCFSAVKVTHFQSTVEISLALHSLPDTVGISCSVYNTIICVQYLLL
jgi:hypothetical protein